VAVFISDYRGAAAGKGRMHACVCASSRSKRMRGERGDRSGSRMVWANA